MELALEVRRRVVARARSKLGVVWTHQHRSDAVGMDCAGIVTTVSKEEGLSDFDLTDYERLPDGIQLMKVCGEQMTRIEIRDMQIADAIVMAWQGLPQHIALLADYLYGGFSIIHSSNVIRKVTEHRLTPEWRSRIVAAYRLPGVPA